MTAIAQVGKHSQWNSIRLGKSVQKQLVEELHGKANVPLHKMSKRGSKKSKLFYRSTDSLVLSKKHFKAIVYSGVELYVGFT